MIKITSIEQLLKLLDRNQTVKFDEDVEFICDIGDWENQINVKIESTESLKFCKSIHVISLKTNKDIFVDGDIRTTGDIESNGNISAKYIFCCGCVKSNGNIKVVGQINCRLSISASGDISAGSSIRSNWYIESGGNINVYGNISSEGTISAKEKITAWSVHSQNFEVKCKILKTLGLPFSKSFWVHQLPLLKWKEDIINNDKTGWNSAEFKKYIDELINLEEKEVICNWEGWHPLLRAQLQMFLGIKYEVRFL